MEKHYWILKTEPGEFSIDDLKTKGTAGETWNGIRNYQARNFLREMAEGDLAFIYHSACAEPAIVGLSEVIRSAYPDTEAFDSRSKYFDAKSSPDKIRWFVIDVKFVKKFKNPLSLKLIKQQQELSGMKLVNSSRLSVSPVKTTEFEIIMQLLEQR